MKPRTARHATVVLLLGISSLAIATCGREVDSDPITGPFEYAVEYYPTWKPALRIEVRQTEGCAWVSVTTNRFEDGEQTAVRRVSLRAADSFRSELRRVIALPDRNRVDGYETVVCDGTRIYVHLSGRDEEDEVVRFEEPRRAEHTREWGLRNALLALLENLAPVEPVHGAACEFLRSHFRDAR